MSDQTRSSGGSAKNNPKIFYALSAVLILTFLWRTLTTAHEYPSRMITLMDMGFDALCIVAMIGLRKAGPPALFWISIVAGIGLFVIRLHGDASWYTGHWNYALSPR